MKIAIITASFGHVPVIDFVPQIVSDAQVDFHRFTDDNFPYRSNSFTPRMRSKIPKMFAWQLIPDYDAYIWFDDIFTPDERLSSWLLSQSGGSDMVLFRHPERESIRQEADFLVSKVNNSYISQRYHGELLNELMIEIEMDDEFNDDRLYAAGVFFYWNSAKVRYMMKDWWYYNTRYHINDQLSLPYVLYNHRIKVSTINGNIYQSKYLPWKRT